MANAKGCYKGHGKYRKEMCEEILQHYVNGESDAEVAVALDVSKQMFYRWIKDKPEFAEAVQRGKTLSECWWQKLGRAGASGKVKIQARVYIANMNNRFGWRENPIDDEKQDESIHEIADALKELNAKHEREY